MSAKGILGWSLENKSNNSLFKDLGDLPVVFKKRHGAIRLRRYLLERGIETKIVRIQYTAIGKWEE